MIKKIFQDLRVMFVVLFALGLIIVLAMSTLYSLRKEQQDFEDGIELLAHTLSAPVEERDIGDVNSILSGYTHHLPLKKMVVEDLQHHRLAEFSNGFVNGDPDYSAFLIGSQGQTVGTMKIWHQPGGIDFLTYFLLFLLGLFQLVFVIGLGSIGIQRVLKRELQRPLNGLVEDIESDDINEQFQPSDYVLEREELRALSSAYVRMRDRAIDALKARDEALSSAILRNKQLAHNIELIEQVLSLANMSLGYHSRGVGEVRYRQLGAPVPLVVSELMSLENYSLSNIKRVIEGYDAEIADLPNRPVEGGASGNKKLSFEICIGGDKHWELRQIALSGDRFAIFAIDQSMARQTQAVLQQKNKMEALGALSSGVAHDFNNILMLISASLEQMHPENADEEIYLENSQEGVERGAAIVTRLLQFVSVADAEQKFCALNDVFESLRKTLPPLIGPSVQIEIVNRDNLALEAEGNHLITVLVNLAINARDAIEGTGRLSIKARRAHELEVKKNLLNATRDYIVIDVRDNGRGIAPEFAERVFDPFFSLKPTGQGTGLGLSMAYEYLQRIGGNLVLKDTSEEGSCFSLYIPIAEASQLEFADAEAVDLSILKGLKILVIDDEKNFVEILASYLRSIGMEVQSCLNVQEAEVLMTHFTPDIILTDHHMPGKTGLEFLVDMVSRENAPTLFLMSGSYEMLTVDIDPRIERISKPFKLSQLATRLALKLASKDAEELNVIYVDLRAV